MKLRVADQIKWYDGRAKHHRIRGWVWLSLGIGAELAALGWLLSRIALTPNLSFIGVFTSIAVAATALAQLNADDQLVPSYVAAASDLRGTLTMMADCDERKFKDLVRDTESAISAENSSWIVRRV